MIEIIAEIAWGHNGKKEHLLNLLKGAKEGQCDWVSIHVTDMQEYMVPYYGAIEGSVSAGREVSSVYSYLEDINISKEDWSEFNTMRKDLGLKLMVMPNDISSFIFSKSLQPDAYVLSAASFSERNMLEKIGLSEKKVFLRIGGSTLSEISSTISSLEDFGNKDIVLLHGVQNYPTKIEDSFLEDLEYLQKVYDYPIGLADHIDGSDPFALLLPVLASLYNIKFVEKHITLNRSDKDEDFEAAIHPKEFVELKTLLDKAVLAKKRSNLSSLDDSAKKYRNVSRKKLVLTNDLRKGDILSTEIIEYKRSHFGITLDDVQNALGRRVNKDLKKGDTLTYEDLV